MRIRHACLRQVKWKVKEGRLSNVPEELGNVKGRRNDKIVYICFYEN
jgi:hypothetical protein